jgi:conjugal transfer pilus assembly protein TraF
VLLAGLLWTTSAVWAQGVADSSLASPSPSSSLDDSYGDAFLQYRPYVAPGKRTAPPPKPSPTPAPAESPKPEPAGKQKVDVAWLRKNYQVLQDRAIDDPTEENVAAFYYVQRILVDKAQRYEESAHAVVMQDPVLNENTRVPLASAGARTVANADRLAQQSAVRELAALGGLLIFVDGNCRFCATQLPVASMVRRDFGMEYLVISTDGSKPADYKGAVLADNGLFGKLGLKLTPSTVFVPRPRAYRDGKDPNQYLVVSQGFYAADEMVKQIAFAGHTTKLLSPKTMSDLDVWDRGVASGEDLGSLELDPNNPAQIREVVQSMLLKHY